MNIAIFTDCYYPSNNGVITVIMQLKEQLIKKGHKVILVTVDSRFDYEKEEDPDNIYRVPSIPFGFGTDQYFALIPSMHHLIDFLKSKKIDVIHCHTEFNVGKAGLRAARILKIPAVCTAHTMWVDFYKFYVPHLVIINKTTINAYMNSYYRKFQAMIAVSSKGRNYYKKPDMIPQMPIVVVPNSIDQSKFLSTHITAEERKALREQYGIKDDEIVLLFVGRVAEEKRILELAEVLNHVTEKNSKIKAVIVGDGPALKKVKEISAEAISKKRIISTGYIDWNLVHNYYESADMFVTCSLSEMHSMTILEAQMTKLPLVVHKEESFLDSVINEKNGYLCDSEKEMEERILELAENETKRKAFAEASYEVAKKFSIESNVLKTIKIYESAIKAYPEKISEDLQQELDLL